VIGLDFHKQLVPPDQANRVIRPHKWATLVLFLLNFTLFTLGVCTILNDNPVGWLLAVPCGIFALIGVCLLLPGCSFLELNEEGFTLCSMFRRESYRWDDVARFGVVLVGSRPKVAFHYAATSSTLSPEGAAIAMQLGGYEAAMPTTFGLDPEDLAVLLNDWHTRSLARIK
jgi:hypothetical protein